MSLLLEEAYIEVKDLSYNIVSRKIIEQGLHKAILDFIARLEIIVDIKYQLLFKCDESHINPFIKSEIFAIVQEANNNIINLDRKTLDEQFVIRSFKFYGKIKEN